MIMGPQTIAAVKDLQRQAALARYLAHGNNQMAG